MSLLTIAQTAAPRIGLPVPNAAASSSDSNIQQLVAFINEEGQELGNRHPWQIMRNEATFNTVAAASQGTITTIASPNFGYIWNETIWNRTQRRPIFGPKSPSEWQQLQAQFVQGPWYQYVIRANLILFTPVPVAGNACYFEWQSTAWCASSGGTGQTSMVLDTDVGLIDERLLTLGAVWRFRQAKGLEYAAASEKYEAAVADAMARDGGKPILSMTGARVAVQPGVFVPAGNWGT